MANCSKTLSLVASKLGLSEKKKILSKAAEFERRLQTKLTANPNSSISDTAKVVICLDLASAYCGEEFDLKSAYRLSGIKANQYGNSKHFVENLLDISSERVTSAALCVSLKCSGVEELAEEILQEYRDKKGYIDLKLPQYVCMAVYQACRLQKVKVSKSKLIEKSRLKPGQFTKLESEWTKFVDENFTNVKSKPAPSQDTFVDTKMEVDSKVDTSPKDTKSYRSTTSDEMYFEWKKRILENAYKEIARAKKEGLLEQPKKEDKTPASKRKEENKKKKIENSEEVKSLKEFEDSVLTLRRSPRKTPQKFDTYRSSVVEPRGIKLLFPVNE